MENDDEVKGDGNSYDFGARIYDPRLGRWMSTDPISNPSQSPYQYVKNNPIYFIDPNGETEFWYGGKWIGTDGVNNSAIAVVNSKDLANEITATSKEGQNYTALKIELNNNGYFKSESVFAVHKDILQAGLKAFSGTAKDGGDREHSLILDNSGAAFKTISETRGERWSEENFNATGGDAPIEIINQGEVSVHSHPFNFFPNSQSPGRYWSSEVSASPKDNAYFMNFGLNLIVGKLGSLTFTQVTDPRTGQQSVEASDNRSNAFRFFDASSNPLQTIGLENVQSMLSDVKKGNIWGKYQKKMSENEKTKK